MTHVARNLTDAEDGFRRGTISFWTEPRSTPLHAFIAQTLVRPFPHDRDRRMLGVVAHNLSTDTAERRLGEHASAVTRDDQAG